MFKELKQTISKDLKGSIRKMSYQIKKIDKKKLYFLYKNQIEILEMKSAVTEIKKFTRGVQHQVEESTTFKQVNWGYALWGTKAKNE